MTALALAGAAKLYASDPSLLIIKSLHPWTVSIYSSTLSWESSDIPSERPQKRRSIHRHSGQAAALKQTSELIQTNESHREHRQSVQDSRATGSEDRVISVRIMCPPTFKLLNFEMRITHEVLLEVLSTVPYCQCSQARRAS